MQLIGNMSILHINIAIAMCLYFVFLCKFCIRNIRVKHHVIVSIWYAMREKKNEKCYSKHFCVCVCACVETVVFVVIHFAVITFERIDGREKPTCTQIHICNVQQKQPEQRNRCERKKSIGKKWEYMSSSLPSICEKSRGWKMRNSFFINHTFRMLFHVLNMFDYFHIAYYIMKQISIRESSKRQQQDWMNACHVKMCVCVFFSLSLSLSLLSLSLFPSIIEWFSSFMELLLCHFTNPDWK